MSYSAADHEVAARLAVALRTAGHRLFFDSDEIAAGEKFHDAIRAAIERSEVFIFLASEHSLSSGSYALSELDQAVRTSETTGLVILPISVGYTDLDTIPGLLSGRSILRPNGDLVADTLNALHRIAQTVDPPLRRASTVLLSTGATTLAAAATMFALPIVYQALKPQADIDTPEGWPWFEAQVYLAGLFSAVASTLGLIIFERRRRRSHDLDRVVCVLLVGAAASLPFFSRQADIVRIESLRFSILDVVLLTCFATALLSVGIALVRRNYVIARSRIQGKASRHY